MRVLRILVALVIAPFFASVSQAQAPGSQGLINGHGHDAAHCAMRAGLHPGAVINKCDPPPPAVLPAACASTGTLSLGSVAIQGTVKNRTTGAVLENWCIEISGPVSA